MKLLLALLLALLASGAGAQDRAGSATREGPSHSGESRNPVTALQPERASTIVAKPGWTTQRYAVAAANPLATQAGYDILRAGGNAVDAAVAVQMVLTLVEPQSSGIGGGAFLMLHEHGRTHAYDGRETAPAQADERLFLDGDGKPLPFRRAVVGGRSVGVPGAVAMLEFAHRRHGRLPWATLLQPAIVLAQQGFEVSPRLHELLAHDDDLRRDPAARAHFFDEQGRPWPIGHRLRNPELAAALQAIADRGAKALIEGDFAQAMVDAVRRHPENPGRLSMQDLASYSAVEREPLCALHRTPKRPVRICGMPPPSSGMTTIGQILGLLERQQTAGLDFDSPKFIHLYTEASRLAYADRAQYIADPAFITQPGGNGSALLDARYLDERSHLIGANRRTGTTDPGRPPGTSTAHAPMPEQIEHGTSHISVVDAEGSMVAMTTSIEQAFGARIMVNRGKGLAGGFLLNNELTDFSFVPQDADGRKIANRVEPGKRPRSSMSPTLVFDAATGEPLMTVGSPGGPMIIHFTAKVLWAVLDGNVDVQRAIDLPNLGVLGDGELLVERGRLTAGTVQQLRELGHRPHETDLTSGLQAIMRAPDRTLRGGADPRREGVVMGE